MVDQRSEVSKALTALLEEAGKTAAPQKTLVPPMSFGDYDAGYESSGGKNIRQYWRAVRQRLWLIVSLVAVMTTLAGIYISRSPNVYEAYSVVQVDLENLQSGGLGESKGSSVIISSPVNDPTYFSTQLRILTSGALLRRVAQELDLENNKEFLRPQNSSSLDGNALLKLIGLGSRKTSAATQPETLAVVRRNDDERSNSNNLAEINRLSPYVDTLQEMIEVKNVQGTRLIEINVAHTDKETAAKIANTIADTFVAANLEKKTETSTSAGDFLEKRIAGLQSRIRTGEERLLNYGNNNQILSLEPTQNIVVERLVNLNKQLAEAENERVQAEVAYQVSAQSKVSGALAQDKDKNISDIEGKLSSLRQRRAALLIRYQPEWWEVKTVEEEIANLEKQVEETRTRATTNVVTGLEARYRQALERERAVRAAFEAQRRQTLVQNEAAINYRIIQQEIETNKSLLNNLLQESKANEIRVAGTQNNIRVADYATVPKVPVSPQRQQFVLITMFVFLVVGVVLALALDYIDDTVKTISDVENTLRLPALATVPMFKASKARRLLSVVNSSDNYNERYNNSLVKRENSQTAHAETYRQLRTSLLLSAAGHPPRTVLVTSSQPGEGKSTTSVNLSITMAQAGGKVLIIDADLRRPQLQNVFGLNNNFGLSNILSQKMNVNEILDIIRLHEESNTYVLTSGPRPPNPAELIGSEQMRGLLKVLEEHFTHVVIDSPPILSFTDGLLIGTLVEGVVLVVNGGRTSQAMVLRSKRLLQSVGAKIAGVVLNKVALRSEDNYYGSYKDYYAQNDEK